MIRFVYYHAYNYKKIEFDNVLTMYNINTILFCIGKYIMHVVECEHKSEFSLSEFSVMIAHFLQSEYKMLYSCRIYLLRSMLGKSHSENSDSNPLTYNT